MNELSALVGQYDESPDTKITICSGQKVIATAKSIAYTFERQKRPVCIPEGYKYHEPKYIRIFGTLLFKYRPTGDTNMFSIIIETVDDNGKKNILKINDAEIIDDSNIQSISILVADEQYLFVTKKQEKASLKWVCENG